MLHLLKTDFKKLPSKIEYVSGLKFSRLFTDIQIIKSGSKKWAMNDDTSDFYRD